jgi:hypothetical protein
LLQKVDIGIATINYVCGLQELQLTEIKRLDDASASEPTSQPRSEATMEESKRRAGPGVYVRVCGGNFVAGAFLYQFAFLMPKARVRIGGKAWYVRSRRQTMAYWGCSERQYKKAIRFLRDEGLIETRYTAGFGSAQALRTTAFRLTDKAMEAIESEAQYQRRSLKGQEALPVDEESRESAGDVTARRNEEYLGRDTADLSSRDTVGPTSRDAVDPIHIKKRSESRRDQGSYLRRSRNANSTQGQIPKQESARKESKAKIDPKQVERVFVEAQLKHIDEHPKLYGPKDRVHIPWGPRLFRMANQFTRNTQIAAAEAGIEVDPLAVVAKCVDRWSRFREYAFDKYRVKMAEKPVMPSLLAAVQPAAEFYLREREKTTKFRPKMTLAEMFPSDKPLPSPRADTPAYEEGTSVDVDHESNVIDTSPQLNASPAPAPTSPERLEDANVALAHALLWPKGIPVKRPKKNSDRKSVE